MKKNVMNKLTAKENAKWPPTLKKVPRADWPPSAGSKHLFEVLRSRDFLVQAFNEGNIIRLSICRTTIDRLGNWDQDIAWDELQAIKKQCGFGYRAAVEIYPPEDDVVNVANMRHLWILDTPPEFMWSDK